jgi:uncharacterized protein (DUF302 family)
MADDLVTKRSPRTVEETVARLRELIAARGLRLFAVIDHDGAAREAGMALRATKVVLFGSPAAGTPVMEAVPRIALDLPLNALVWDDGGTTKVTYLAPAALAARHGLNDEQAASFAAIDALTDALVAA